MEMKSLLCVLLFCSNAYSYIPSSDYVIGRVVKSHGKGTYSIENEVTFRSEAETLTAKESWIIQDGETMRLSVKAGSLLLTFIYNDGKVFFAEEEGKVLTRKLSIESLERYFHARTEKTLSDLLMSAKVLSLNPLRPRPRPRDLKTVKPEIDPFMRLVRIAEDPMILISNSSDSKESMSSPGIWIDQDNYTIRKIKFPSQTEVLASNYQSLSNELIAPRLRTVNWGQNSVEIRLIKASGIAKSKDLESQFSTSTLGNSTLQWGNSSLLTQIKEFYQRFR